MNQCIHKMSVGEIWILKWISKNTRNYKIQNEEIRLKIGWPHIDENMWESHLRCLKVQKKRLTYQGEKVSLYKLRKQEKKCGGRPKITLIKIVKMTYQLSK